MAKVNWDRDRDRDRVSHGNSGYEQWSGRPTQPSRRSLATVPGPQDKDERQAMVEEWLARNRGVSRNEHADGHVVDAVERDRRYLESQWWVHEYVELRYGKRVYGWRRTRR